jgi:hypothetical protein
MRRGIILLLATFLFCAQTYAQTYATRSLQGQYPNGDSVEVSAATTTPNGVEIVGIRRFHNGSFDRTPLVFPSATSNAVIMNPPPFGSQGYISAVANTPLGVIEAGQYDGDFGGFSATHAVVWNGTPNSAVDLHIASGTPRNRSVAYGVSATATGFQATGLSDDGGGRDAAAVWMGSTPQSSIFRSLHASGMFQSRALVGYSFNGLAKQAGYAEFGGSGQHHPVVWSNTADSYIDILPAQFFAGEVYCATGEGGQELIGGIARDTTSDKPIIWRGTGGNFQVLSGTPQRQAGQVQSINGARAVGKIHIVNSGSEHAAIWDLVTGQVTDLHSFLPFGYENGQSSAFYVDAAGNVYGSAQPSAGISPVPFVWMIPEPAGGTIMGCALAVCLRRSVRNAITNRTATEA